MLNQVLNEFFEHPEKYVICLKGDWGVGKTYSWNQYIENVENNESIKTKQYSYVSLFGLSSVQEIKRQIFFNSRSLSKSDYKTKMVEPAKKLADFVKEFPIIKKITGNAVEDALIRFGILQNTIICLDDIERKNVQLLEILGLVDLLKNEYKAKVVLIFNEEKLNEEDQKTLTRYREKVIDVDFEVQGSTLAVSEQIFNKEDFALVSDFVNLTGLKNIRVLQQASWVFKYFKALITEYNGSLQTQILQHTLILSYIHFDANTELNLTDTSDLNFFSSTEQSAEIKIKRQDLQRLKYHKQKYDKYITEYILKSHIDQEAFLSVVAEADKRQGKNEIAEMHKDIWGLISNNFSVSTKQVISGFGEFLDTYSQCLTINEIESMVNLLNVLGAEHNSKWIDNCITNNLDNYDIRQLEYALTKVQDQALINEINTKITEITEIKGSFTIKDILYPLVQNGRWNDELMANLDSFSDCQYLSWMKSETDPKLLQIIRSSKGILCADEKVGASIWSKIKAALIILAAESELNKQRVERFLEL